MSRCARCDVEFFCGVETGACWCASVDVPRAVLEVLAAEYAGCLCPACLASSVDHDATHRGRHADRPRPSAHG
jgi:hypothetical protein